MESRLISSFGKAWKNSRRSTPNCCAGAKRLQMNNPLSPNWASSQAYAQKRFDLPLLGGLFCRPPTPAGHSRPRRWVEFGSGRSGSHSQLAATGSRNQVAPVAAVGGAPSARSVTTPLAMSASVWTRSSCAGRGFGSTASSNGARPLKPAKSTVCWWSVWMPTNSFAATIAVATIA